MKTIAFKISKDNEVSYEIYLALYASPVGITFPFTREIFQIEYGPEFSDQITVILSVVSEWEYKLSNVPFGRIKSTPFHKIHFGYTGHYIPLPKLVDIHNYMNMQVWLWLWRKYGSR